MLDQQGQEETSSEMQPIIESRNTFLFCDACITCYREARDQKFSRNEGDTANQHRKAMAVADMNLVQWLRLHLSRSFPMRTVIPADAQAAANVRVEVICSRQYMHLEECENVHHTGLRQNCKVQNSSANISIRNKLQN